MGLLNICKLMQAWIRVNTFIDKLSNLDQGAPRIWK